MIDPVWLAAAFGISEMTIAILMRSKNASDATDRGSLRLLMVVMNCSMAAAMTVSFVLPLGHFGNAETYWIGAALFAIGMALRWFSIAWLGRFFTVDVTIAPDQHVIDTGPYRFVRHPSYTGILLILVGLALCFGNLASPFFLLVPPSIAFMYRMRIEEAALTSAFGESYKQYVARTKRLIPFIY